MNSRSRTPRHTGVRLDFPSHADDDLSETEEESDTLKGLGRREHPSMPEFQLAFLQALDKRDQRWEHRFEDIDTQLREARTQVAEIRTIFLQWIGSRGIRNSDNTPRPPAVPVVVPAPEMIGTLNVEAGPVKLRGRPWIIAALALAAMVLTATAYVLGKWGRPTHDSDTVHQLHETTISQWPIDVPSVVATQP
jgi:hypothetical protein